MKMWMQGINFGVAFLKKPKTSIFQPSIYT